MDRDPTTTFSLSFRSQLSTMAVSTICLAILAIFLPPLAVFLDGDGINMHFWINIVLCIFFWFPGILHALWCVFRQKEKRDEARNEAEDMKNTVKSEAEEAKKEADKKTSSA